MTDVIATIAENGGFGAAGEWADAELTAIPNTKRGFNKFALRGSLQDLRQGQSRPRKGIGGGWEYHYSCLPEAAQQDYLRRVAALQANTAVSERRARDVTAEQSAKLQELAARRRIIMQARAATLQEITRRNLIEGGSLSKAVRLFLAEAEAGLLSAPIYKNLMDGVERSRGTPPSFPTVMKWQAAYNAKGVSGLVPEMRAQETKQDVPEWLSGFLRHYAKPGKPTLTRALEKFTQEIGEAIAPSYDQVRRAMKALQGTQNFLAAHKGREGPLALKARLMFTRRTLEGMEPTIVYTADGKTFDAEIAHPLHGQPFRPEITTIIDVVTRKIVGWSIDLAENSRAVTDALRYACMMHGVPAILYVDRGPGYKNEAVRGLCARLGITVTHSRPYNSQARGQIERVNGSVWNKAAKEFATYIGADMDREAAHRIHKRTRKDLKQFGTSDVLPTFNEFIAIVEAQVEAYNNAVHSNLRVRDLQSGRMRNGTPNEAWAEFAERGFDHFPVEAHEVDDLFRPHVKRRSTRGEVHWISNQYADPALQPYHGMDVLVGYDIHDGSRVWVRELETINGQEMPGRLICVADFYHNKERYFPQSFEDHAREKRVKGQLRRLDDKRSRAEMDLREPLFIDASEEMPMPDLREAQPVEIEAQAEVVELHPAESKAPSYDPRNPSGDPDIALAWEIVDQPPGSPIPPHHVGLMWDVLRNFAAVEMMKDVQLPITELEARLTAAANEKPLKSSIGG
ncbi:DDE-type integrase/transposase/recombinase [Epibacterium ulvae]|uniref:DDE-type integrase/transposase/recombinase n=1 Tax=Epibacterium ulvae TaxID=1156985 RepID=UPI002490407E|nr:DDE-type integrase/transposase/recombinase [Epibacterium ulvae]